MKETTLKGGEFLIQETKAQDIFTPEDFTEEQKMMRDSVIEFVDREIVPSRERLENKDFKLTEELMQKAGSLGFLGVGVPEKYGGMGMDYVSRMLVCDYISGATGSFSTPFGAHTGIGTLPIVLYGSKEQRNEYVPKLASGEWFASYCLTEPGAGSDANSGKTKAVLSEDGSHYKISGQKIWISNAGFAKLFIVFARIEDDKNITSFIVPYDPKNGITLGEEEKKLGINSSSTRQVFFNETKVPVKNVLAKRGEGFKIAVNALNVGRIQLGAACLEAQRRVITISVKYANERIQFKKPISQFGAIKEKLARMATTCYVGESATYRAADDIDKKISSLKKDGFDMQKAELKGAEEFAIECSILKVSISEDVQNASDDGIQIFGGMGFSAEAPMESAWRDARIGRIYEGTNEINRMLSVGMLLKKGLKGELDLMEAVLKSKNEIDNFGNFDEKENFGEEKQVLKNLKKVFLLLLGISVEKFGPKIEEQQQVLLALSDMLIEIYLSESGMLRTEKNIAKGARQEIQIAMTKLYLFEALEIILKKAKEIIPSISKSEKSNNLKESIEKLCNYKNIPNVIELKTKIADKVISENKYCF
ncbi:MAG: acyl-CoA dehydrogenase family protein [Bacteroidota bacterium]|nr:acyl-CoA dehydrogenase family protein [Bacteroidota bacterium]